MKIFRTSVVLLMVASFVFIAGCGGAKQELTLGEMENSTYTNDYFGLSFDIPEEWTLLSQDEIAELNSVSQEIVGENNEELAEQMDLAKEQTLNLVYSFKHPLNYMGGFNPNFMCMAENLNLLEGMVVKNGTDYLHAVKKLLQQTGLPYEYGNISSEEIGGKSFNVLAAQIDLGEMIVEQKYYSAVMDGYAMSFIVSYSSDTELAELDDILDTVQFDN